MGGGVDTSKQMARFLGIQDWRLAGFHDMRGATHRSGWINRHDLPSYQPAEHMTDSHQMLFDGRCR